MGMLGVIRTALKDGKTAATAAVVALLAAGLLAWLSDIPMLFANNPAWFGITSLALAAVTAVLFGLVAGLFVRRFRLARRAGAGTAGGSVLGFIGSAVASGCPVCGSTLLAGLGLGGATFLAALPLKGLELKLAGIGLLALSLMFVARSLDPACKRCEVKRR